jgi:hypothetical protein
VLAPSEFAAIFCLFFASVTLGASGFYPVETVEFESGGNGMGAPNVRCLVEEGARFVFSDPLK